MTKSPASLNCHCGKCEIAVLDPEVRSRLQCLCFDCRQREMISADRGNSAAFPESLARYEHGVDILYFANALQISASSRDLLCFEKLREDGNNTTAYSRCCGTIMMSAHPLYLGQSVKVFPENCRVTGATDADVAMYVFMVDCPEEARSKLPLIDRVPCIASVADEMESEAMQRFTNAVTSPVEEAISAQPHVTYEDLYRDQNIVVNNAFFSESRRQS